MNNTWSGSDNNSRMLVQIVEALVTWLTFTAVSVIFWENNIIEQFSWRKKVLSTENYDWVNEYVL